MASSVYRFLQGAWPFGVIEIAWTPSRCGAGGSAAKARFQELLPMRTADKIAVSMGDWLGT